MDPIGGGLPLLIDALKFHRLRREWVARLLFLSALLVAFVPVFLPDGKGFHGFFEWVASVAPTTTLVGTMTAKAAYAALLVQWTAFLANFDLLDAANVALSLLLPAVFALLATLYANAHADDLADRTDGKPLARTFRATPRLLLLYVLMALPLGIGLGCLLFVTYILQVSMELASLLSPLMTIGLVLLATGAVLLLSASFAPMYATAGGRRAGPALAESFARTRGFKLRFASLDLMLVMGMNIPSSLLQAPFLNSSTSYAAGAVGAFFTALTWMMLGRLHGRFYHLLAVQPDMKPDAPKPTEE